MKGTLKAGTSSCSPRHPNCCVVGNRSSASSTFHCLHFEVVSAFMLHIWNSCKLVPAVELPLQPTEDEASSPPRQGTALVTKRPESAAGMPSAEGATFTEAPEASGVLPHATTSGPPEYRPSTKFLAGTRARQIRKTRSFQRRRIREGRARCKGQTLDIAHVTARVSQLKSIIRKDPDPPSIAAEMAVLYLVLSEHKNALKSFRLAMAPSPGKPSSCEAKIDAQTLIATHDSKLFFKLLAPNVVSHKGIQRADPL